MSDLASDVVAGKYRALARAISLVERTREIHRMVIARHGLSAL